MLDDRDDYSNGQPMRMRASRKRRSLQKRLMGSTDSLDALDELAANRASTMPALFTNRFIVGNATCAGKQLELAPRNSYGS